MINGEIIIIKAYLISLLPKRLRFSASSVKTIKKNSSDEMSSEGSSHIVTQYL